MWALSNDKNSFIRLGRTRYLTITACLVMSTSTNGVPNDRDPDDVPKKSPISFAKAEIGWCRVERIGALQFSFELDFYGPFATHKY